MKVRTVLRPYPVAFLLLLAVLAAVWVVNRPVGAQTLDEVVLVDNFGVAPNSKGYVTIDFSGDPTIVEVWAVCGGAYPQSGTSQIPSQVLTRKPSKRVLTLRMFNPTGHVVTAPVRINCTIDILSTATTSPSSLRDRVAKLAQQASSR